jgi:GT2 family glycosyltransferase
MPPTVTAIVVAHRAPDDLQHCLDAVRAQTRPVETLVVVGASSDDAMTRVAATAHPDQLLSTGARVPFGAAVGAAVRALPEAVGAEEWLWLLAEDTVPESEALAELVDHVAVAPSVAVAGPKLVDGDEPSVIRELGLSMTPFGSSVVLVEDELDQGQHDRTSDVLGVPAAGTLIRRSVWDTLGGFDPGLPVVDDGLDLGVRARLAGHRVTAVPSARVASFATGVSAPVRTPGLAGRHRQHRQRRAAQLHRRMVYAPAFWVFFHWLTLVPLAVWRSLGLLLSKQPGFIGGEFGAAFGTAFGGSGIRPARRAIARTRTVKWRAVDPLRVSFAEVRHMRAVKREASLVRQHGERGEFDFFTGGGAWVVLAAAIVSLAIFAPLLGADQLAGGGLLPLSELHALWSNVGYGWRDIGAGFVGAADPFTAVLAVLGTVTFWQPSFSLVLLWFAAMPLAALGAWFLSTRVTHRPVLRAVFAMLWAVAPMLFDALQQGRPAAVALHVLLPWLFFAGTAARRKWAAGAATALLAAAVAACAPSLIPALAVLWVIGLLMAGRGIARVLIAPIPTIALFAPLAWEQFLRGTPLAVFADPGVPLAGSSAHPLHLALGFSDGSLGSWQTIAASLGMPGVVPSAVVPILMAPLAILALLALFLRGTIRAALCLVAALLGFVTAILAVHVAVSASGAYAVTLWPGAGLDLYWLGLIAAATMALVALGRFAALPAAITVVFALVAVTPLAIALPLGRSAVSASGAALPAYVDAQAQARPRIGTLVLTPQSDGALAADLVRGTGMTLDDQSTLNSTRPHLTPGEKGIATLAGNLASQSGLDESELLKKYGVSFVLLSTTAGDGASPASATLARAETALAGNPRLTQVAATDNALLWSVPGQESVVAVPANAGGVQRVLILLAQIIVFGLTLLLALPTGRTERGTLRRLTVKQLTALPRRPEPGEEAEPPADPETTTDPGTASDPQAVPDVSGTPTGPVPRASTAEPATGDAEPEPVDSSTESAPEAPNAPAMPAEGARDAQ